MNVRVLVVILLVGVLAIGGLTAVYFTMFAEAPEEAPPAPPPPPPDTDGDGHVDPNDPWPQDPTRFPGSHVQILVASEEIEENTLVEERHLREEERAKGDYPEGTFLKEQSGRVLGEITKTVVREGEPFVPRHFFGGRRLAFLIPRFMRAVSFNYDNLAAIGGNLRPGDVVDIMGFFTIPERSPTEQYVKVFMQGVKVLGIGSDFGFPRPPPDTAAQGGAPPPPPPPPSVITFALTPREAELLFWAERSNPGGLRYALRSPLQSRLEAVTPGQTGEEFYGLNLMRRPHKIEIFAGTGTAKEASVDRVED